MKEYKYKINGTEYTVQIGDIVENIANVTVNGENFQVEMENEPEPEKKKEGDSALLLSVSSGPFIGLTAEMLMIYVIEGDKGEDIERVGGGGFGGERN